MNPDSIIQIPRDFNAELERIHRSHRELIPDAPPSLYGETTPVQEKEIFPMPEEAPQVPPLDTIRAILENPASVNPEIVRQVWDSINGRRACEWLRLEDICQEVWENRQGSTGVKASLEFVRKLLADSPIPQESEPDVSQWESYLARKREAGDENPKRGEIWSTSDQLNGPDGKVFMYLPPTILVVNPSSDRGIRVIPCSLADCWPMEHRGRFDFEIQVAGYMPLVAHLWLETHVSSSQMVKPVGGMESSWLGLMKSRKQLDAPGANLEQLLKSEEEGMDDMAVVQRRQIEACARYLACNLTGESKGKK
jgi:hypothetical protein